MKIFLALMGMCIGCSAESLGTSAAESSNGLRFVDVSELDVNEGWINVCPPSVSVPKMRATFPASTAQLADLRFIYRGPTADSIPLASGEFRTQLGLKLRAQNECNIVYVMWRFAPTPGIVVQVKSNPGMSTSAACGNGGYTTIKSSSSMPVPSVAVDSSHAIRATLDARALTVEVDGATVWQGDVGPAAMLFDGPIGIRSDDAAFEFGLLAVAP
jgi:hypothetical protein